MDFFDRIFNNDDLHGSGQGVVFKNIKEFLDKEKPPEKIIKKHMVKTNNSVFKNLKTVKATKHPQKFKGWKGSR